MVEIAQIEQAKQDYDYEKLLEELRKEDEFNLKHFGNVDGG